VELSRDGTVTNIAVAAAVSIWRPAATAESAVSKPRAQPVRPLVRFVYLVPADQQPRNDFADAVRDAALDVKSWYAKQTQSGKTFSTTDEVVEIVRTPHVQDWYARHCSEPDQRQWFWNNSLGDAADLLDAHFNDPLRCWVLYIDAEHDPGQSVGGTSGIALLPRHDLLGLIGQSIFSGEEAISRWHGGLAHELGHALGLPHPPACESNPRHADCESLMMFGFRRYPKTNLLREDLERLGRSPFFEPRHDLGTP
jgi:hypothetical protein